MKLLSGSNHEEGVLQMTARDWDSPLIFADDRVTFLLGASLRSLFPTHKEESWRYA